MLQDATSSLPNMSNMILKVIDENFELLNNYRLMNYGKFYEWKKAKNSYDP